MLVMPGAAVPASSSCRPAAHPPSQARAVPEQETPVEPPHRAPPKSPPPHVPPRLCPDDTLGGSEERGEAGDEGSWPPNKYYLYVCE
jgi:hypothetical protein